MKRFLAACKLFTLGMRMKRFEDSSIYLSRYITISLQRFGHSRDNTAVFDYFMTMRPHALKTMTRDKNSIQEFFLVEDRMQKTYINCANQFYSNLIRRKGA